MKGIPHQHKSRILVVSTEFFESESLWEKISGIWSCVKSGPSLRWMKGMNADSAKIALLKMGASWHWTNPEVSGSDNTPMQTQSLPSRGGVHSESHGLSPLDTAELPSTASITGTRGTSTSLSTSTPENPSDPLSTSVKTLAQPVTKMERMTTESASVLTRVAA